MKRRRFFLTLAAALGLDTRDAAGDTEVRHGPNPRFAAPLTGGIFTCTVVGRQTKIKDCGAGGVTAYCFKSNNPSQQNAELLVLRTAFLEWFREMYEQTRGPGQGSAADQVAFVTRYWSTPGYSPGPCRNSPTDLKPAPPATGPCAKMNFLHETSEALPPGKRFR